MTDEAHKKIDELIDKKKTGSLMPEMQIVYDNSKFMNKVRENPVINKEYDMKIFGHVLNLNDFIAMRLWPRSIYKTDHLIRLSTGARYDFLKRYLAKKRRIPFDMWWLILIIGIPIAVVLFILLLGPMIIQAFGGLDLGI